MPQAGWKQVDTPQPLNYLLAHLSCISAPPVRLVLAPSKGAPKQVVFLLTAPSPSAQDGHHQRPFCRLPVRPSMQTPRYGSSLSFRRVAQYGAPWPFIPYRLASSPGALPSLSHATSVVLQVTKRRGRSPTDGSCTASSGRIAGRLLARYPFPAGNSPGLYPAPGPSFLVCPCICLMIEFTAYAATTGTSLPLGRMQTLPNLARFRSPSVAVLGTLFGRNAGTRGRIGRRSTARQVGRWLDVFFLT